MVKNFIKDMIKYLPAHIIPAIVSIISTPIITRFFSPEAYGNYSLAMAVVMILTTLSGWLSMSIIRFYPVYELEKKLGIFYGNVVNLMFISSAVITIAFLIFVFCIKQYISPTLRTLMYLGVGVFIVYAIFEVFQSFLRAKRQINQYSGFAIWKSMMGFGLGIALVILFKFGIEALLWGAILSIVIISPLLWKMSIRDIKFVQFQINYSLLKKMVTYSFPLVIGNLAAWILSLSDRYFLEFFRGAREVGIYSAGYNIAEKSIMVLFSLFALASGPISMQIWERDGVDKAKEYESKLARYYLMVCIPAVAGLSALSKPVIAILTGVQYHDAYKIISFITLGVLFLGLQSFFQIGFLFYKRTGFVTFAISISGLLNMCLNFIFIPKYGYMAAALTTLFSYIFLFILMVFTSRRIFSWKFPFKSLIKISCATAIMGTVVYFIGKGLTSVIWINLAVGIFIGGLVYFLALLWLREFNSQEKKAIKQFFRCSTSI